MASAALAIDDADEEEHTSLHRLMTFADHDGDISTLLTDEEITTLGHKVVEDWERDDASRSDWKETVQAALDQAAQEKLDQKTTPWVGASNVDYPILTVASQQFNARAYPAIIKGDEAVGVKVLGEKPKPLPPQTDGATPEQVAQLKQLFDANQKWQSKTDRAKRVKDYLNYVLFYGMEDWEDGVDTLLIQLPIAGTVFKKVYYDEERGVCSDYVNPLRLTVAMETQSLKRCPRITQDFDLYPYEMRQRMASGFYRTITIQSETEDDEAPRVILEQHRMHDLDGDGIDEPYIVTVDKETSELLRIEADFDEDDVFIQNDRVVRITRYDHFVKFPFLRDPKGRFYETGFGQLLKPITAVINTAINEMLDAGHAQVAGGGFIASGLRLQGPGQSSSLKWRPGVYMTASVPGNDLRNAIYERTLPNVSPITFQLLELMLGAAKEIANIKDVLTGEAPTNAPVGTTLALIEQGLQQFTAIYKRVYRAMREEFQLIYKCEAKWGGKRSAAKYAEVLDDPDANFEQDFSQDGSDIVPVSDPTVVTRQQRLAKSQVVLQVNQQLPGVLDPQAVAKRVLEAADIDNVEELIPPPQAPPGMKEELENKQADTAQKLSTANLNQVKAVQVVTETGIAAGEAHEEGLMDGIQGALAAPSAGNGGGSGDLGGQPGNPVGAAGPEDSGGGPEGQLAGGLVGDPASGPNPLEGTGDAG